MGVLGGAAGALGVAETDAAVPLLCGDLGEQEYHFGHGLLAAGEDLGITDGNGEGKPRGGKLDVPDEVDGTH
jgi:hypothetical protein